MGFLDKLKPKKEIAEMENFDTDSLFLKPFAILQEKQLDNFVHGLFEGCHSLYDKVYEKTGKRKFAKMIGGEGSYKYKVVEGFEEYTYLAAFEALLGGTFGWGNKMPSDYIEYGQGKFFDENGFSVSYSKEQPLYDRKYSKWRRW